MRMKINSNKIKRNKIKNRPDYLFNDDMIANIKDFDSGLLKIYKFSYRRFLDLIFTTFNTSQQKILII